MSIFKKISDAFSTYESRFKDAKLKYLVQNFNNLHELDISIFPSGLRGRQLSLPDDSPLHKLSIIEEINLPELLLHICLCNIFYIRDTGSVSDLKDNNIRVINDLKSNYPNIVIETIEFNQIIEDSTLFLNNVRKNSTIIPSTSLLFFHISTDDENGMYDNIFKAFYIFVGFCGLVGMPVLTKCNEIINDFLIEQNSKSIKSIEDFSEKALLNEILNINYKLEYIPSVEIDKIKNDFLNESFLNDNIKFSIYLDLIKLSLIYDGQTLQNAEDNISNLIMKLMKMSQEWDEIVTLYMKWAYFNDLNSADHIHFLAKNYIRVYSIFYKTGK